MRVPGIPYVQGRNDYPDSDGTKYAIAIHNTSNDATAEGEASYATRRTDGISAHFYADHDSVVQSLDTRDRAGHAGSSNGNNHAVAVEITGVNGWSRQQWLDNVAWDKLGAVLAQVCRAYGIAVRRATVAEMQANPRVKAFYGHDDMRRAWGDTTHTDPGPHFPWDRLFTAVNKALNPNPPVAPKPADPQEETVILAKLNTSDTVWVSNGVTRRPLASYDNQKKLQAAGVPAPIVVASEAALTDVAGRVDTVPPSAPTIDYTQLAKALLLELAPQAG